MGRRHRAHHRRRPRWGPRIGPTGGAEAWITPHQATAGGPPLTAAGVAARPYGGRRTENSWGARSSDIVAALWPERCTGIVSVSGYLIIDIETNRRPLPPRAELGWWYQYYSSTERGRRGYTQNTNEFNKLIWQLASPKWDFDDATFDRTAASFHNPDHVDIVIHNYRWRLGLAEGEQQYAELETRLFEGPVIRVPAITIGSDFDGAAADGRAYAAKFAGDYSHRVLDGIGHNVPQEAPAAFADAVLEISRVS